MKYPHLFSPIEIAGMELRNRAVMPAMGTGYGNMDNTVSDRLVHFLKLRARGGTGLVITEVCAVLPRGKGFSNELGAWSDDFIPTLAKIPEAIHEEGAKGPSSSTMPVARHFSQPPAPFPKRRPPFRA